MKSTQSHKEAALEFLRLVVAGGDKIDEAYATYASPAMRHHNPFCAAGMEGLRKGMKENDGQFPHKAIEVKRVLEDGDFVAVHSRVILKAAESDEPNGLSIVAIHLFRFDSKTGLIAELWDIAQPVPKAGDSPNKDGMF